MGNALVKLAAAALFCTASLARAADVAPVWLIDTRSVTHCGDLDGAMREIGYQRLDDDCRQRSATAEDFRATDDVAVPTIVFFHGNRTDAHWAVKKAWHVYQILRSQAPGRAFRYVIWSWPADPMLRPHREDARLKAVYSDAESYYLAQWLDQRTPGVRVSLVGHSFGPRIINGALHLLAGGEVAGRSLPQTTVAAWSGGKRNPVRAVLLAAAADVDCLAAGQCHGLALSLVDQMLVTRNGCDWILRRYPRLEECGGPDAIGLVGPCLDNGVKNVEVVDVAAAVGKRHDWRRYCEAPGVYDQWTRYTFLDDSPL